MTKFLKIVAICALIVLVVFAGLADRVTFPGWLERLSVALYLRLVALIGLIIALFLAWGYRRKVEASQRFRRSQQVLAEAEVAAQRKQDAVEQARLKLEAQFADKEQTLNAEIDAIKAGYIEQIKGLKEQNLKLKEMVSNLMKAVKQKR
jgi:hypothetical protein